MTTAIRRAAILGIVLLACSAAMFFRIRRGAERLPGSDSAWDMDTDPPPQWENRPYRDIARTSLYLRMRDGIKLAVDVYLPRGLSRGTRIPALLCQERYYREVELRWPFSEFMRPPRLVFPEPFVSNGYGFVLVDVRGSGASFGYRRSDFSADEVADATEIVNWIVSQTWSDGRVGGYGTSYSGTAAELLLATRHPAVKAFAAISSPYDLYLDATRPGGIAWTEFIDEWGRSNQALDDGHIGQLFGWLKSMSLRGVRPVDSDPSHEMLRAAVREHAGSYCVSEALQRIVYRDDRFGENTLDAISPHTHREAINASGVPIYSMAGWFDLGASSQGAIERFLSTPTPGSRLTIGPWPHSYVQVSPGHAARDSRFANHWEILWFFDFHLKGKHGRFETQDPVHYWTVGEEKWKTASTWPPPGTRRVDYFFGPDHSLTIDPPSVASGRDSYHVDNKFGRAAFTRWDRGNHDGTVGFSATRPNDGQLLVYESSPLKAPAEMTGQPVLRLSVASTLEDGQFFAYLEDVDPTGKVAYVTEGLLRSLHRRPGHGTPPYSQSGPWHTFLRADALPMVPGEPAELAFSLLPVSYLFPARHRIRIALGGADKDHFEPLPGLVPEWQIFRNREHPSQIALPLVSR